VSDEEYAVLRLIAATARGLFARYPFDDAEQMHERWRMLGLYLARLQVLDDRRDGAPDRTAERCRHVEAV